MMSGILSAFVDVLPEAPRSPSVSQSVNTTICSNEIISNAWSHSPRMLSRCPTSRLMSGRSTVTTSTVWKCNNANSEVAVEPSGVMSSVTDCRRRSTSQNALSNAFWHHHDSTWRQAQPRQRPGACASTDATRNINCGHPSSPPGRTKHVDSGECGSRGTAPRFGRVPPAVWGVSSVTACSVYLEIVIVSTRISGNDRLT